MHSEEAERLINAALDRGYQYHKNWEWEFRKYDNLDYDDRSLDLSAAMASMTNSTNPRMDSNFIGNFIGTTNSMDLATVSTRIDHLATDLTEASNYLSTSSGNAAIDYVAKLARDFATMARTTRFDGNADSINSMGTHLANLENTRRNFIGNYDDYWVTGNDDIYFNAYNVANENTCNQCKKKTTSRFWCQPCNSSHFQEEYNDWKSHNDIIDEFIREVQLNATDNEKVFEWIPYSKFKDIEEIGEGGFGKVYSAKWTEGYILYWNIKDNQWKRKGTTPVALKSLNDSQNINKEFLNEIKNHHYCNKKFTHITKCYGITQDEETRKFMIVMQLAEDGSLVNYLTELQKKALKDKLICLSKIADGLHQVHRANLVHGDFHPGNILLSRIRNNALYITDLGLSKPVREFAENQKDVYGVLPYVAPEVLGGEKYTTAADVYAFGTVMYEVMSGIRPFGDVNHDRTLVVRIRSEKHRPKIPRNTPALIVELIQKCWDDDPQKRLSSHELQNILGTWRHYENWPNSELYKQIKECEDVKSDSPDSSELHAGAFYTTRCLTGLLEF